MRLASWAVCGTLLINMVFGLVVVGVITAARPVVATALTQCGRHAASAAVHRPADDHYLAAVRMGWAVG